MADAGDWVTARVIVPEVDEETAAGTTVEGMLEFFTVPPDPEVPWLRPIFTVNGHDVDEDSIVVIHTKEERLKALGWTD